ncbi:MAG: response regulator, partial [Romboutsia sp.]|nr:response regulator [Romboutsia sp.]
MNVKPILVVEDDQTLREAITETLLLHKYNVDAVSNGASALKMLQTNNYGIFISAIHLGSG